MNRRPLRIKFVDFWDGFKEHDNYFLDHLSSEFEPLVSDTPDLLFYSVFGDEHRSFDCTKVFFTGECVPPDFETCDYSLSFDLSEDPRNFRLPLYALYGDVQKLTGAKPPLEEFRKRKRQFCCMVLSSPIGAERIEFFHRLSLHRFVHSAGRYLNNIGFSIPGSAHGKLEFIKDFRFVLAFENQSFPGYTTEKIFEPMLVNSIPIYWGNPEIARDFNPLSFINGNDFHDLETLAQYVIEVDNDPKRYERIYREPWFTGNKVNDFVDPERVRQHLCGLGEQALSRMAARIKQR